MDTLKPQTKKAIGRQYAWCVFLLRGMQGQLRYMNRIKWIKHTGLLEHLSVSIDNKLILLREEYLDQRDSIHKEK